MIYVNARALLYRAAISNNIEVLIQTRNKEGQPKCYELPGGQVNPYESLIDALKREVYEETGLSITKIHDLDKRIMTRGTGNDFLVECVKPFAAYQTLEGPVDSMGVYFLCKAKGTPVEAGDDSKNPHWVNLYELKELVNTEGAVSSIDRPAILMYLNSMGM